MDVHATRPGPLATRRLSGAVAVAGWLTLAALCIPAVGRPSLRLLAGMVAAGFVAATATVAFIATALVVHLKRDRSEERYTDSLVREAMGRAVRERIADQKRSDSVNAEGPERRRMR
jgi:hypothetical protein